MLLAAKDENVASFIYAASSSTYGDRPALPKKKENIGNPLPPYAVTKYVNELYADVFFDPVVLKALGCLMYLAKDKTLMELMPL